MQHISKQSKIYIAGHNGMVGSAIWRVLHSNGYTNLIGKSSKDLDLRNQSEVEGFFKENNIDVVVDALRASKALPKRVMLMEWLDPIFNCGHWIPHQIGYAGGIDMLSNPSGDSVVTPWDKILKYNPEILVVAPCGFTVKRTLEEMHILTAKKGWNGIKAVQENKVFIADFDLFTQSSANTLVNGIELLAGVFHPDAIQVPKHLSTKFMHLDLQPV